MDYDCVRYTALPNTSKLFADYVYHFDRVARFYAGDPYNLESFRRAAAAIDFPEDRRSALAAALREQNAPGEALDRIAQPGTAAVLTGQQVGLFSGPCYTIYKALTAARLARRLTEAGVPAVPVFWLATEDHDFAEVNHAWVFNASNEPVRLAVEAPNGEHRPVGGIAIDAPPIEALRRALEGLPFGEEVTALVEEAYTPGATMGAAFAKLLARLLAGEGMLFFDPMHPASRRLAAPLLAEAARRGPELTARVLERNRELTEAGYHVQVHVEPKTSFVFLLDGARRLTLRRDGNEYAANGRRFQAEELAARAENLSPNALLRPVVQDSMFPTAAYVGGPAELAYLSQSQVLYQTLLGRMPLAMPRQSATLLDARAGKLFERYDLSLADFFHGSGGVRERIAARLVPAGLEREISDARTETGKLLDRLERALAEFDPTLEAAFQKSRRKIDYQLAKTGRKAAREAFRRDERATAAAAYLNGLVFPEKHLQERLYSILPFLARHGLDLIGKLGDRLTLDCLDHRVLVV
ncbi:MAG: bacillithiol biosynthesis cysteine-adding enzyme BshC [Acidobacteriota bacterium]